MVFSSSSSHLLRSVRETPALSNQSIAETGSVRGRPGLPYKFPISMYLAAETRLWPDLGGQTIFSAETTFCRTNHPQTNFSPAERHLAGPIPIHRGDLGGTGNPALPNQSIAETGSVRETPGLPYRTFTPPDFHARAGSAQKTYVFLCRACCIGVGLPVLLPRRAGFPRRSARCGGILRYKLRETPVSLCATIKVLFLMLVLSAEE